MGVIDLDARVKKLEAESGSSAEIDQIEAAVTALENTVGDLMAYSTTEAVVGTWVDDSDVYQKVLSVDIAIADNHQANDWINTGEDSSTYSKILEAILIDASGQLLYPDIVGFLGASTTLGFKVGTTVNDRRINYMILRYTKVTAPAET